MAEGCDVPVLASSKPVILDFFFSFFFLFPQVPPEVSPIHSFWFRMDQLEREISVRHQCRRSWSGYSVVFETKVIYFTLSTYLVGKSQSKDEEICEMKVCIMSST